MKNVSRITEQKEVHVLSTVRYEHWCKEWGGSTSRAAHPSLAELLHQDLWCSTVLITKPLVQCRKLTPYNMPWGTGMWKTVQCPSECPPQMFAQPHLDKLPSFHIPFIGPPLLTLCFHLELLSIAKLYFSSYHPQPHPTLYLPLRLVKATQTLLPSHTDSPSKPSMLFTLLYISALLYYIFIYLSPE